MPGASRGSGPLCGPLEDVEQLAGTEVNDRDEFPAVSAKACELFPRRGTRRDRGGVLPCGHTARMAGGWGSTTRLQAEEGNHGNEHSDPKQEARPSQHDGRAREKEARQVQPGDVGAPPGRGSPDQEERPEEGTAARYSPGKVVRVHKVVIIGNPNDAMVCTSHVERSNLSMRTSIRRMTRLTLAHSKKWRNHQAAIALWFAYYNYCRVHTTLTEAAREEDRPANKTTPAMAAGLAEKPWNVSELLNAIAV